MSYDICFIKRTDLNSDNIEAILETDVTKSDKHYISMQLMLEIKDQLIQKGLEFEVFQKSNKQYLELNFPTYQVCMYESQIAISVPYWDKNSSEKIDNEINIITELLLDNGFTGYDSQMGEFIRKKKNFGKHSQKQRVLLAKH